MDAPLLLVRVMDDAEDRLDFEGWEATPEAATLAKFRGPLDGSRLAHIVCCATLLNKLLNGEYSWTGLVDSGRDDIPCTVLELETEVTDVPPA